MLVRIILHVQIWLYQTKSQFQISQKELFLMYLQPKKISQYTILVKQSLKLNLILLPLNH